MKRIQLFEFEDFSWFPNFLRMPMTRYINAIHKMLGSAPELAKLLETGLKASGQREIIDLCAGSGGPMQDVMGILRKDGALQNIKLKHTDLYPNLAAASEINNNGDPNITYETQSVDATKLGQNQKGLRTMICSLHHMPPKVARQILEDAQNAQQPFCAFEISDNSFPKWIWWIAIPINYLMVFFITFTVKPMTWQQIVFTYLIPLLPFFIAWDGAVSNARTYTLDDMDELLAGLESPNYRWEKGLIKGKAKKLYLMGMPITNN